MKTSKSTTQLLDYFKPYKLQIFLGIGCMIFVSFFGIIYPWILKYLIDDAIVNKSTPTLNLLMLLLFVLYLLLSVCSYGQNYLMPRIGQGLAHDLREKIYNHFQKLSLRFYETEQTGKIMSSITNDIAVIQEGIGTNVKDIVVNSLLLGGAIFFIFIIHWKLGLIIAILIPLLGKRIGIFGRKIKHAAADVQTRLADLSAQLQETLSSMRIIKSFTMEEYEINRFGKLSLDTLNTTLREIRLRALVLSLFNFLEGVGVVVVLWYGGYEIIKGNISVGELLAFMIYSGLIIGSANRMTRGYTTMQRALASFDRIFIFLGTEPEIADESDAVELPQIQGLVKFENVSFGYQKDRLVLKNIDLDAKPNEVIALVGPSGAGKTTLINLLMRFYDPLEGKITIDGYDIKKVKLSSLREKLGFVPQEDMLFNTTVDENISYGKIGASMEEIVEAAKIANAHEFIKGLPYGYQTIVGERGTKLSRGQQQRISIARAILRNPKILILDEATSSLDSESEALIIDALNHLMKNRTTFVIAHRLSTVQRADNTIVIDKGKIVEVGKHKELLVKGGLYSKLYKAQFEP